MTCRFFVTYKNRCEIVLKEAQLLYNLIDFVSVVVFEILITVYIERVTTLYNTCSSAVIILSLQSHIKRYLWSIALIARKLACYVNRCSACCVITPWSPHIVVFIGAKSYRYRILVVSASSDLQGFSWMFPYGCNDKTNLSLLHHNTVSNFIQQSM